MGVYRSLRMDQGLWPVPATGQPDAWIRTHRAVRVYGSGVLHAIEWNGPVAYVTECGLTLGKDAALRCRGRISPCCTGKRKGLPAGLTDPGEP